MLRESLATPEALPKTYSSPAVALHWLIAILIACGFVLGLVMGDLAASPRKLQLFSYHKWIGMTVMALACLRVIWRATHRPPAALPAPAWQETAAKFAHGMLYALMFVVPLVGWMFSSASGYPVVYLGLWQLPDLVAKNKELARTLGHLHEQFAWLLFYIMLLHILAVAKHQLVDRDGLLRRMWWPARSSARQKL